MNYPSIHSTKPRPPITIQTRRKSRSFEAIQSALKPLSKQTRSLTKFSDFLKSTPNTLVPVTAKSKPPETQFEWSETELSDDYIYFKSKLHKSPPKPPCNSPKLVARSSMTPLSCSVKIPSLETRAKGTTDQVQDQAQGLLSEYSSVIRLF